MLAPILTTTALLLSPSLALPHKPHQNTTSWPGWSRLSNLFIFGDSYTQTGFNPTSTQPSAANPFGNPPYPGWTSSNGPNWVGFLTTTYNQSALKTYNLAYGGATVDSKLVTPYAPTVISMKEQVETQFVPIYGSSGSSGVKWGAQDSLFAFWIGINDVGNSWWLNNATLYDAIFATYANLLDQVYAQGARNFLLLQVPPVNLSPLITSQNDNGYATEYEGKVIADWNARVAAMAAGLKARKTGVEVFIHETNAVFMKVIKDPKSFEQTSGLKNVTGFCAAYKNGAPTWYTKDPSCEYAVNEYLWLNDLHPTFPIHNATAADIVKSLPKATIKKPKA